MHIAYMARVSGSATGRVPAGLHTAVVLSLFEVPSRPLLLSLQAAWLGLSLSHSGTDGLFPGLWTTEEKGKEMLHISQRYVESVDSAEPLLSILCTICSLSGSALWVYSMVNPTLHIRD